MINHFSIITGLLLTILVTLSSAQTYQSCTTPNRVSGSCMPIKACPSVLGLLQNQPLTDQTRNFLRQSQCGGDYQQPWVCCPTKTATVVPTRAPVVAPTGSQGTLPKAPQCGIDAQNRIYGGQETKIDEYTWLAQIGYDKPQNKKGFHCGGSLINNRYVLTAAHCVKKVPDTWKLTKVRLGEWDTLSNPDCDDTYTTERICNAEHVDVPVAEKIVHDKYEPSSKNQHHDIALLRMANNVEYTDFIRPICLPLDSTLRNLNLQGHNLDVAGWGKTETSSSSTRKLKVNISVYSNSDCQRVYSPAGNQIIDGQICAGGDPGKDSCNGDSGGPLMEFYNGKIPHYFLAGIVSYGPRNCGTKDIPGVYTRVSKYVDWIQSNIRN